MVALLLEILDTSLEVGNLILRLLPPGMIARSWQTSRESTALSHQLLLN